MPKRCLWIRDCFQWDTSCGDSYNPYVKSDQYPKIKKRNGEDICPYCGGIIDYLDEEDEDGDE